MLNFNIHWKGCPHRHLPRIRVASSRRASVHSRSIAHVAAEDAFRRPLTSELELERKKQRSALLRRRLRRSCSSLAAVRTRKLASLRARQHIHAFGWDTDIASKANTAKSSSSPSLIKARAGNRPPTLPQECPTSSTLSHCHDGPVGSIRRRSKPVHRVNEYS
jgi:hypothetical protein